MALSSRAKVTLVSLSVIGVVFLIVGSVVHAVFPGIYADKVAEELILEDAKNETMERWIKPPVPLYMTFVMFNVTNPDEVNARTAKPFLEEIGPYIYREEKVKNIVSRNDTDGTLEYRETTTFFYEPELNKNVDLNAEIYHINAPDLGVAKMLTGGRGMVDPTNYLDLLIGVAAATPGMVFDHEAIISSTGPLIVKHTVNEILFEGYDVPSFRALKNLNLSVPEGYESFKTIMEDLINGNLPPDLKFSAFADRNNTQGPLIKIYTGQRGISNLTIMAEINGARDLGFYEKNSFCDRLNGTDGMQFPPDVNKNKNVFVYSPDVCRSLEFEYSGTTTLKKIKAFRFVLPERIFSDPKANDSENACFCKETDKSQCTSKGLLPVVYCMQDKPVLAMSAPHFLMADDEYLKLIDGIKPEYSKHFTFLDIEPNTGAVIRGVKRLQVNVLEERNDRFPLLNPTEGDQLRAFPLFWLEERGEVDQANADYLRSKAIIPKEAVTWGTIAGIAVGIVFILVSIVFYFIMR